MSDENIDVKIRLIDDATKNLAKVKNKMISDTGNIEAKTLRSTQRMSQSWRGVGMSMSKLLPILAGVGLATKKVIDFKNESIELAKVQIDAEASLAATLGYESENLKNYAAQLQATSTYGDEVVISSMSLITAFIKEEKAVKRIQKAALDLAAAKKMDLRVATDLVVKSISSGTNALSRYGIQMEKSNDSSVRMESLLKNIDDAFGGVAQAIASTDVGTLKQMENTVGDLKEKLGTELMPLMVQWNSLMLDMAKATIPKITTGIRSLSAIFDHIRGKTPYQVSQFKEMVEVWKESSVGSDILKNKLNELTEQYSNQRVEMSKLSKYSGKRGKLNQEMTITKGMIDVATEALKSFNAETKEATAINKPKATGGETKTKKKGKKFDKDAWLSMIGPSREDYEKQIVTQQDFQKKMYDDAKKWSEEAARLHWEAHQKEIEELRLQQDREKEILENRVGNYMYFGQAIGSAMAQGIVGGEGAMKDALKNTLAITIGFLEKQMIAATVGNQLKSFMTMGPIGLLKATGETALITGIFETAKAGIMAFKDGGVVDYGTRTGDRTIARVNKNEMILNEQQQANLWKAANNGSQEKSLTVNIQDSSGTLVDTITTKIRNGDRGVDRLVSEILKRVR
jgi:hypothetical protein